MEAILSNPRLKPISDELNEVYETLKSERLKHGGEKELSFYDCCLFH